MKKLYNLKYFYLSLKNSIYNISIMKKIFISCLLVLGIKMVGDAQIIIPNCETHGVFLTSFSSCNTDGWKVVYEDNFNGNALDIGFWEPQEGVNRDNAFSLAKQWFNPANIEVSNGTLKLYGKRDVSTHTYETPTVLTTTTFDFSGAEIRSRLKFYTGSYEMRCRIPNGKGFWPAFWTYGGQHWNEIDVFDNMDGTSPLSTGMLYDDDGNHEADECRYSTTSIPDLSQWHIYTCTFENDKLVWQLDYNTVHVTPIFVTSGGDALNCGDNIGQGTYFKQKSCPLENMKIIASLTIRSNDKAPDASTVMPGALEIDYIRFSKRKSCYDNITFTDVSQLGLNSDPQVYNYICGRNIAFDGNITIPNNINLSARESITFLPGFTIGSNGYLSTKITPDPPSVSINGPRKGTNSGSYTWSAAVSSGIPPYTYHWWYSINGGASFSDWGTASSITASMPLDLDLTLKLIVTAADGQMGSEIITVMNTSRPQRPTSIDEENVSKINVYPNPTDGEINIHFKEEKPSTGTKIIITNALGKNVLEQLITSQEEKYDISVYTRGIYLIRIIDINNNTIFTNKLIKK
jgi:beta-glucanase (GH16 family)